MAKFSIPEKVIFTTETYESYFHVGAYSENNYVKRSITRVNESKNGLGSDNEDIDKIKIISDKLVKLPDQKYIFIDPKLIVDCAINGAISNGGTAIGPFKFIDCGGTIQLVRKNGDLYKQAEVYVRRQKAKKLSTKTFEQGGVYVTPGGKSWMYLDKVDTVLVQRSWKSGKYEAKETDISNARMFVAITENVNKIISKIVSGEIYPYNFSFKKSHSFVDSIGKYELPQNLIFGLRNSMRKKLKTRIAELSVDSNNMYIKHNVEYEYHRYIELINVHYNNEKDFEKFNLNKYMIMS